MIFSGGKIGETSPPAKKARKSKKNKGAVTSPPVTEETNKTVQPASFISLGEQKTLHTINCLNDEESIDV